MLQEVQFFYFYFLILENKTHLVIQILILDKTSGLINQFEIAFQRCLKIIAEVKKMKANIGIKKRP